MAEPISKPKSNPRRERPLGPFAFLVMCQLARLDRKYRYAAVIERELTALYGEEVDAAQVFVALKRLAENNLVQDVLEDNGTRTVAVYTIKPAGREALRRSTKFYKMLADAAPAT